jgi:hypothetical protein
MTCKQVPALPQSSVAAQVLLIVNSLRTADGIIASVKVMVGVASQTSLAVAVPVLAAMSWHYTG